MGGSQSTEVEIGVGSGVVHGDLAVPDRVKGVVVFAHGSGSSRHSARNRVVAAALRTRGLATLLMDLLTAEEDAADQRTAALRFDIELLASRLVDAVGWLARQGPVAGLPVGCFGASTGAAAALVAAARRPGDIAAVVSRGGRPDLAGDDLRRVSAPTLLIVGGRDQEVLAMNSRASARLGGPWNLEIVPGATHLFEEAGALEEVARLAGDWFTEHLGAGLAHGGS